MPTAASRRPARRRGRRWRGAVVVAVVVATVGCGGATTTPSTSPSIRPPPAPTATRPGAGAVVPAFDRGRFAAVIPLPGARTLTVADGVLWVLEASATVVRIDPRPNAVV